MVCKYRLGRGLGWGVRAALLLALASSCAGASGSDPRTPNEELDAGPTLPLKSLRLYDVGIGYFERSGTLDDASSTRLPVPVSHVDDALKTLIVLSDFGKVSVSGIEFGSVLSDSLARVLAGIPVGTEKAIRYLDVLRSLRGLAVRVQFKDSKLGFVHGTLLEVSPLSGESAPESGGEEDARAGGSPGSGAKLEPFQLTLLQADGALRRFTTEQVEAIYPKDTAVGARLDLAASTLAKRAAQLQRGLRIDAKASGPIRIGYMAETPVWRATYRLVLEKGGAAVLQGWALVHNDTDEAWQNLDLELINGRPDSFLFPLAAPRYARRQLAEPSEALSTAPQLSRSTADQMWGDYVEPDPEEGEGLGLSGIGEGGGGRGEGIGLGSIGTLGHGGGTAAGDYTTSSDSISIGNLAQIVPAAGEEGLTLYSYDLGSSVNIRAHGSALVPFFSAGLEVKRITLFKARSDEGRSASIARNSTNKTLPPGVLAVYESSGFAGETQLERLKPGERQLLQFGYDLDAKLESKVLGQSEQTQVLYFRNEALERHYLRETRSRYTVSNRGGLPRTIHAVLGIRNNSRVEGADALDYHKADGGAAAVFEAPARSSRQVELRVTEALRNSSSLEHIDLPLLDQLLADPHVPAAQHAILLKAREKLVPLDALRKEAAELDEKSEELKQRQERLHEHDRELGEKEETPALLVSRILELEDAMSRLEEQSNPLVKRITAARQVLAEVLAQLGGPAEKEAETDSDSDSEKPVE